MISGFFLDKTHGIHRRMMLRVAQGPGYSASCGGAPSTQGSLAGVAMEELEGDGGDRHTKNNMIIILTI